MPQHELRNKKEIGEMCEEYCYAVDNMYCTWEGEMVTGYSLLNYIYRVFVPLGRSSSIRRINLWGACMFHTGRAGSVER